jgi:hypothetical protein
MHILNVPTDDLDYAAVQRFLALKRRETLLHDYKEKMPDGYKLAKTVAAFANTHGGVLLIGVSQDPAGGPGVPVGMVGTPDDLRLQAESAVLDNAFPYIGPDVAVVPIPAGEPGAGKSIVVVRTFESLRAPHVMADGAIYSRVEDSSKPERYTDLRRIEYLLERRQQNVADRKQLVDRSLQWFEGLPSVRQRGREATWYLSICPTFPFKPLCSEQDVEQRVGDLCDGARMPCPGGIITEFDRTFDLYQQHGNYGARCGIHVTSLGHVFLARTVPMGLLWSEDLIDLVVESWVRAAGMLQRLKWAGQVTVQAGIRRTAGTIFLKESPGGPPAFDPVESEEQVVGADLLDASEAVKRMYFALLWGLGHRPDYEDPMGRVKATMSKTRQQLGLTG